MFKMHVFNDFSEETIKMWRTLLKLIKLHKKYVPTLEALINTNLGFVLRMINKLGESREHFYISNKIYQQKISTISPYEKELNNHLRIVHLTDNGTKLANILLYDSCYLLNHLGHLYNYTSLKDPEIAINFYKK